MTENAMARVDFYVLQSESRTARLEFMARLLGKLQSLGTSAYIAVESPAEADEVDALLWTHPPESFLPHRVDEDGDPEDVPYVISARQETGISQDVFINLRAQPPACHGELQRLVEIVVQEQGVLAATRRNFRFYREQGHSVESHPIRSNN